MNVDDDTAHATARLARSRDVAPATQLELSSSPSHRVDHGGKRHIASMLSLSARLHSQPSLIAPTATAVHDDDIGHHQRHHLVIVPNSITTRAAHTIGSTRPCTHNQNKSEWGCTARRTQATLLSNSVQHRPVLIERFVRVRRGRG